MPFLLRLPESVPNLAAYLTETYSAVRIRQPRWEDIPSKLALIAVVSARAFYIPPTEDLEILGPLTPIWLVMDRDLALDLAGIKHPQRIRINI